MSEPVQRSLTPPPIGGVNGMVTFLHGDITRGSRHVSSFDHRRSSGSARVECFVIFLSELCTQVDFFKITLFMRIFSRSCWISPVSLMIRKIANFILMSMMMEKMQSPLRPFIIRSVWHQSDIIADRTTKWTLVICASTLQHAEAFSSSLSKVYTTNRPHVHLNSWDHVSWADPQLLSRRRQLGPYLYSPSRDDKKEKRDPSSRTSRLILAYRQNKNSSTYLSMTSSQLQFMMRTTDVRDIESIVMNSNMSEQFRFRLILSIPSSKVRRNTTSLKSFKTDQAHDFTIIKSTLAPFDLSI